MTLKVDVCVHVKTLHESPTLSVLILYKMSLHNSPSVYKQVIFTNNFQ